MIIFLQANALFPQLPLRRALAATRPLFAGWLRASSNAAPPTELLIHSELVDPGIQILTLNNAKRANALSLELIKQLHEAINAIEESKDVRAVIVRGSGNLFSAGHDLNELVDTESPQLRAQVFARCSEMMLDLANLPMPTIASVQGPAYAAGLQLVASCDLVVAGFGATFAAAGVRIGLFCSTPAVPLVRAIGLRATRELVYTGNPIAASRAHELGLVHRVVPDEQVHEAALELAREISSHSAPVVLMGKKALNTQASLELSDAYSMANQVMLQNLELEDTQLGIKAFIQKQPLPKWTNETE